MLGAALLPRLDSSFVDSFADLHVIGILAMVWVHAFLSDVPNLPWQGRQRLDIILSCWDVLPPAGAAGTFRPLVSASFRANRCLMGHRLMRLTPSGCYHMCFG